jgi:hypothetical protein
MWKTFAYSFSLLLLSAVSCSGQGDSGETRFGLRLGADLSRIVMDYLQPNRRDGEFSADMQVRQSLFAVAEGGWNKSAINNPDLGYKESGYFWRIGVDYNVLAHDQVTDNNIIYGGIRIGHASFNQSVSAFQINDSYWGNVDGSIPLRHVSATWVELVAGMQIEAIKNIFVGWSVRERILFKGTVDPLLTPYVIPGFGKGAASSAFDFNYSIYYRIPFLKVFIKPKPPKPAPTVPGHISSTKSGS